MTGDIEAPAKPLPKRIANKLDKRERIMLAARKSFYAKGFYQTRLSEVARLAKVAKGTIFLYADSKEALLWLVFIEDAAPALLASLDPDADVPLRDKLIQHFEATAQYHRAYPELARVAMKELTWANPISAETSAFFGRWLAHLRATLEASKQRGEIESSYDAGLLARLIVDLFVGISRSWLTHEATYEEAVDRLKQSLALLLPGLKARAAAAVGVQKTTI